MEKRKENGLLENVRGTYGGLNYIHPLQGMNHPMQRPQSAKYLELRGVGARPKKKFALPVAKNAGFQARSTPAVAPDHSNFSQYSKMEPSKSKLMPYTSQIFSRKPSGKQKSEEELQAESIKFKQEINEFKAENILLKTKISQIQKEIDKKDKLIQSIMEKLNSDTVISTHYGLKVEADTSFIVNLKRQINELREEVKKKEEEFQKMKKKIRSSKIEEMELMSKMKMDECTRLRATIDEKVKEKKEGYTLKEVSQIEEKFQQQSVMLTNMRKENEQLLRSVQIKEQELLKTKSESAKQEEKLKKHIKNHQEYLKNKRLLKEARIDTENLSKQLSLLKVDSEEKSAEIFQARIDNLITEQTELKNQLERKQEDIADLEVKISQIAEVKKMSPEDVEVLRKQVDRCEKEAQQLRQERGPLPNEKLSLVTAAEIENDIQELKYYLICSSIPGKDIQTIFFEGYENENTFSIYELARLFQRLLARQTGGYLQLARFIIEPDQNSIVDQKLNK